MYKPVETEKSFGWWHPLGHNISVVFLYGSYMKPGFKGKGFGAEEQKLRMELIQKEHETDAFMCTVSSRNIPQIKICEKNGWVRSGEFVDFCCEPDEVYYVYIKQIL